MLGYTSILNSITAACAAAAAAAAWQLVAGDCGCVLRLLLMSVCLLLAAAAAAAQWVRSLRPCNTLSSKSVLMLLTAKVMSLTVGKWMLRRMLRVCRCAKEIEAAQQAALLAIVRENSGCQFGQDHGFSDIRTIADFRARVPLREYKQMQLYYDRAYRGEENVLYCGPVEFLMKSSGTTGRNKHFPMCQSVAKKLMKTTLPGMACTEEFKQRCGRPSGLVRILGIRVLPADRKNEFGIAVGPMSKFSAFFSDIYTLPPEALRQVNDTNDCMYLHAVFALWHENIDFVDVFFPSVLSTFLHVVQQKFDSVLRDVAEGRLSEDAVQLDSELRQLLNRRLSPKPQRAEQLRRLFADGADLSDFFAKAWPSVSCVTLCKGGGFAAAYQRLRKDFLGDLPTYSVLMGGSEGFVGINASLSGAHNLDDPDIFHPNVLNYFIEFVPLADDGSDAGDPQLMHELKVGANYEVAVTSSTNYRLRTGDVVRTVGRNGALPLFMMWQRKSMCLTVHVEKTSEHSLQAAVSLASQRIGRTVTNFCAADSFLCESAGACNAGKFYVFFLEFADSELPLTSQQSQQFDSALREADENYNLFRSDGSISQLQVRQVRSGGFQEFKRLTMSSNPDISEGQFKQPTVLTTELQLQHILQVLKEQ